MAFASLGSLGSANSKTAGTSVTALATAIGNVGNLAVALAAWDNTGLDVEQTNNLTFTDESGNTWTKAMELTGSAGVVEDGATAALWLSVLGTQIDVGDDLICTSDTARVAKAISAWEFDILETAVAVQQIASGADSGQPAALTLSGLPSREYLLIHVLAMERPTSVTLTQDPNFTNLTFDGTTGGASTSNMVLFGGYRIATGTTFSVDVATSIGGDHAQMLVALYETSSGDLSALVNQIAETDTANSVTPWRLQKIRPSTDITDGGWTNELGGTTLAGSIDETTASDVDYIQSSESPLTPDICEIKCTVAGNPLTSDDGAIYNIRYRYMKNLAGGDTLNVTVRLVQAGTVIASWTHTGVSDAGVTATQNLSNAEANAITDHGDLRLRFEAVKA